MSGFVTAMSACFACKKPFTYNPRKVPAFKGEPVCEACMTVVNKKREGMGLPPHAIHPDAYEPCPESEL